MTAEEWRAIPGHPGYEVSNLGRVRSWKYKRPLVLAQQVNPQRGYRVVQIRTDGKKFVPQVHKLVTLAFLGPRPEGQVTRHLNDDKADNTLANLVYGTASENQRDSVRNGVHGIATRPACSNGHPYVEGSYSRNPRGHRQCRACMRIRRKFWYDAKRVREQAAA